MNSIDALRDYLKSPIKTWDGKTICYTSGVDELLDAIEREVADMVRLPVDADGVPIRVGDVLDATDVNYYAFLPAKVVGYHECFGEMLPIVENNGEFQVKPEKVCHHRAPTVEDVLEQFLTAYDDADEGQLGITTRDVIAEYAAKLRLAGDAT